MQMREILFRGKRKDNGEWIQGDLLHDRFISSNEKICRIYNEESKLTHREDVVIPETVGQYTGRKDMHGTKIFEGDIVVGISGEGYVCFWDECNYEFGIKNDQYSCSLAQASYYTTVADNIHDIKLFGGKEE